MTAQDIAEIVGSLFAAYSTGFISGFLLLTFKRLTDLY